LEKGAIIGKYKVKSILHADDFQSVFICELADGEKSFIVNEYKDAEIIAEVKDAFIYNKQTLKLIETFESEGKFYAVFPGLYGTPLYDYISKHNLTIADKMYFTDGILKKFIEADNLHYAMQLALCDLKNISVQRRSSYIQKNRCGTGKTLPIKCGETCPKYFPIRFKRKIYIGKFDFDAAFHKISLYE
jgi:hypothetical protein